MLVNSCSLSYSLFSGDICYCLMIPDLSVLLLLVTNRTTIYDWKLKMQK